MSGKVYKHAVIVDGVFYNAGEPVITKTSAPKETPDKKAVKKETPSTK